MQFCPMIHPATWALFSGRGARLLDSFVPLLIFLITNSLVGLNTALWGALITAGLFGFYRIIQKESLVYALGGLGGVLLAASCLASGRLATSTLYSFSWP